MALFRVMRVGGAATFVGGLPTAIVVPPVVGTKARFQPMWSASGVALFRGATGAVGGSAFEDVLGAVLALTFEVGNSNEYEDQLVELISFRFSSTPGVEVYDSLEEVFAFGYDHIVQAEVGDQLQSVIHFDFTVRARIRGWNEEKPLPPGNWTPAPKPNLF